MKIYKNDVLVLEIDDYGLLKRKIYNKDDMENIKIVEGTTEAGFKEFIYLPVRIKQNKKLMTHLDRGPKKLEIKRR